MRCWAGPSLAEPTGEGGVTYGASDEWSYKAAEKPTYCYDVHATMLHLLGIDHEKLVYRHNGLDRSHWVDRFDRPDWRDGGLRSDGSHRSAGSYRSNWRDRIARSAGRDWR